MPGTFTKSNNVFEEGQVLLINKPLQWTSFDVVKKIRNLVKVKKVGHAGTLDPLASGLLVICTGKFTKKINEFMSQEKEYTGTITLGAVTPTYDLESKPENFKSAENISPEMIHKATAIFKGEIMQTPPAHSAIKVDGKRLYELARKGNDVKPEPRKVFIREFEIIGIDPIVLIPIAIGTDLPVVHFRVVCSTGTYIRSLAYDFGKELGCGGYLSSLCRTRIGSFLLRDAFTMEAFEEKVRSIF